jgi:hypothetical protein
MLELSCVDYIGKTRSGGIRYLPLGPTAHHIEFAGEVEHGDEVLAN